MSSNHASTSKTDFLKLVKVEESSSEGKQAVTPTLQGKKISIELYISYLKPKVMHPPRKLSYQRFVPICHYCGKGCNIRPHCFYLKPHMHINKNSYSRKESEGLVIMMREVLSRLDKFEQSRKSRPKISQVWVRKDEPFTP